MYELTELLNNPEDHYPGNFDTPQRANALLTGLCQDAAKEIAKLQAEVERLKASIALDKMAENARELGLDYEPALMQQPATLDEMHAIGNGIMYGEQPAPVQEPVVRYCCHSCFKIDGGFMLDRMILCPECGNKRCPKASDHQLDCTGSNEPNQPGSVYTAPQPVPVKTYHDGKPWPVAPKPWVGLTDEEVAVVLTGDISLSTRLDELTPSWVDLVRAIETKLKEKNT